MSEMLNVVFFVVGLPSLLECSWEGACKERCVDVCECW